MNRFLLFTGTCLAFILISVSHVSAQYKIRGTVYDSTKTYAVPSVSVLSTSGKGAVTNSNGDYEIEVNERDSIWFSYLNKPTVKFPVLKITSPHAFDISIQLSITVMKEVKIRQRNYRQDSIQNREDYAKVFNYEKPGLKIGSRPAYTGTPVAAGFDLESIIEIFNFKKKRQMASFQRRLIQQEQDRYVDHRFSKALVRRLTGLDSSGIVKFMNLYRPPYEFTVMLGEYDFQKYIKDSYERYRRGLPPLPFYKVEEEEDGVIYPNKR
ncbi:carboxypeptidase-like regulatory domain-containing protein [Terrimonas sp. NA20]|uniref:Carboxypeptidase-like regulatory domain-containing protein n=1 Tax=Terrimonas ginsenosidimutans TaxID=2908004 RepID=A0ABS9KKP6_9BACT|nr:carboxypeptidase-like regulatory domain-containing protein [Terrimonas ginsenosidimutans]MCG2612874.1 carboxypeptidase-like regulatory domain-containing protein [Terrimonas ginsenosidimutans]